MFKRRTLFVVGAGASQEAGFPVGTQLARTIGKKLQLLPRSDNERGARYGDNELFIQLHRAHNKDFHDYVSAAQLITNGIRLASSIDDFLNIHSEDEKVKTMGKAAIVSAVLQAEKASTLFIDPSNIYNKMDFGKIESTWFVKLMRVLGPGVTVANVQSVFDEIGFIVFNYDRCVEHFLIHALRAVYGISREVAEMIVDRVPIIHPYGRIGDLKTLSFGGDPHNEADYFGLAQRIKTYTEQIEEGDTITRMHEQMHRAGRMVFLGLAYGEQNMILLKPDKPLERKSVFGTAYQMSDSDQKVVQSEIARMFKRESMIEELGMIVVNNNITCSQLFDFYARSLNAP
jgi:hypothetical protein